MTTSRVQSRQTAGAACAALACIAIFSIVTPPIAGAQGTSPTTAPPRTQRAAGLPSPSSPIKEFGTMWTFDAPPLPYWKARYNFSPDKTWLDHVRLASVRLPICSSSFVSARGLVMTNHHCGRDCTAGVSPKDSNYIETGWAAATLADEKKCPGLYVDQLQSIEDVTTRVRAAITAKAPAQQAVQRAATVSSIERECGERTQLTCQVVSFYQGGMYSLYRYQRYVDVRLVMVPEGEIAFYGGDPDNFTFPRYDLDLTLLRVYENGQPLQTKDFLKWSPKGAAENELVFVTGNPGSTGRLLTMAQMQYLRDVTYPTQLAALDQNIAIIEELSKNPNEARSLQNDLFTFQNSRKAIAGYLSGLTNASIMARKRAFETDFRRRIAGDPKLRAQYGGAWDAIAGAERELTAMAKDVRFHSLNIGGGLLNMAAGIVRLPVMAALPDSGRLPQYRGPGLDQIRRAVLGDVDVNEQYEIMTLAADLRAAQKALAANDPYLRAALGGRSPEVAAEALVRGTKLASKETREALVNGGTAAVNASTDPMIVLARTIEPINRRIALRQARLTAIIAANAEKIGQAIFAAYGTTLPPDATFTLRISDGVVKGYPMNGTVAPYKTSFYGLYARAAEFDNKEPFKLPPRWAARRDRLDLSTPYDFVSTNDIIGGNSGSPVINRNAEVVGLIFDGNIESLPNRFIFTDDVPRSVSVSSLAITEALRKVYDAGRVADELEGKSVAATR